MILILIILLTIIYIQFGLFALLQIILWLIVFISSNVLIGLNPWNIKFHITRILSICVIIYILWYNSQEISVQTSIMLPLSISKIDFIKDFEKLIDTWMIEFPAKKETFYFWDDQEIKDFLKSLANENYIVNIYFFPSESDWNEGILLSNSIVINSHSSPTTIRKFIKERLHILQEKYNFDDIIDQSDVIVPKIEFHYTKIKII